MRSIKVSRTNFTRIKEDIFFQVSHGNSKVPNVNAFKLIILTTSIGPVDSVVDSDLILLVIL